MHGSNLASTSSVIDNYRLERGANTPFSLRSLPIKVGRRTLGSRPFGSVYIVGQISPAGWKDDPGRSSKARQKDHGSWGTDFVSKAVTHWNISNITRHSVELQIRVESSKERVWLTLGEPSSSYYFGGAGWDIAWALSCCLFRKKEDSETLIRFLEGKGVVMRSLVQSAGLLAELIQLRDPSGFDSTLWQKVRGMRGEETHAADVLRDWVAQGNRGGFTATRRVPGGDRGTQVKEAAATERQGMVSADGMKGASIPGQVEGGFAEEEEEEEEEDEEEEAAEFDEEGVVEGEDICFVCDDGGDLVTCDSCCRVFHSPEDEQGCGCLEEAMAEGGEWSCPNCRKGQHLCFICKRMGLWQKAKQRLSSVSTALPGHSERVYMCNWPGCGLCYHLPCVSFWLACLQASTRAAQWQRALEGGRPGEAVTAEKQQPTAAPRVVEEASRQDTASMGAVETSESVTTPPGPGTEEFEATVAALQNDLERNMNSFRCPRHACDACGWAGGTLWENSIVPCRRCPRAYHVRCIPTELINSEGEEGQRVWGLHGWAGGGAEAKTHTAAEAESEGVKRFDTMLCYCQDHEWKEEAGGFKAVHHAWP